MELKTYEVTIRVMADVTFKLTAEQKKDVEKAAVALALKNHAPQSMQILKVIQPWRVAEVKG